MTRENYRTQMRAVFLAAIMVISMVGMSVAFAGTAVALSDGEVEYDRPTPYQGQTTIATVSDDPGTINDEIEEGDDIDLRVVDSFDGSGPGADIESSSFIEELEVEEEGGELVVEIDTDDLETEDYFLRHDGGQLDEERANTFEVREQRLDADFDDDVVTDAGDDAETELDIDSNRGSYSVNTSADGDLNDEELLEVFVNQEFADGILVDLHRTDDIREAITFNDNDEVEIDGAVQSLEDAGAFDTGTNGLIAAALNNDDNFDDDDRADFVNAVDDPTIVELDGNNEVDVQDSDAFADAFEAQNPFFAFAYAEAEDDEDEQIVLVNIRDTDEDVSFLGIDDGDYTFDFNVADTEASSSADITVREEDQDGSFSQGVYQQSAGDIVDFELELEDTDEAWIQIGDEGSGYADVIYIVDDDETGEVEFSMNTRLAGTDADTDEVYFSEDDEIEFSAVHDWGSLNAEDNAPFFADEDDDVEFVPGDAEQSFSAYLEELGLVEDVGDDPRTQLTRPLQATDYEVTASADGVFVADDGESEADDELDSASLELLTPELTGITTWTAPSEDADEDDELDDLLDVVTERSEIAEEDRLVIQVEATGLYGAMAAKSDADDDGFAIFEDGTTVETLGELNDEDGEGIDFNVEAEEATGNQDPTELRLDSSIDEDEAFVVVDDGQFFVVVNTDEDRVFRNGDPDDHESFTATLEYETDDDDRYEFDSTPVGDAFDGGADGDSGEAAYPYFGADSTDSISAEFDIAEPSITFENLNADEEVQAENVNESEISGTTNIAPGSDAELRVSSTDASTSFRISESSDIDEDGDLSAEFDLSEQEPGDEFDTRFRVSGSNIDTVDSVIVAEGDLGVEDPVEDDEADDEDDVVDDEDDVVDDDDDVVDDDDDVVDDETDDETPGFGALVALVALIGAALLAARRQN